MYVVAGSPRAMRAGSRAALRACVDAEMRELCLNSGRIGGAARGRVARARPCQAPGVCKRAASHGASGVRALASLASHLQGTKPAPHIVWSKNA